MIETMKILLLKNYFNVVLIGDESLSVTERLYYLGKTLLTFGPIAFILDRFDLWFAENQLFFTGAIFFIFLNMIFGACMHKWKKTFSWKVFIVKTMLMTTVILITYLILEVIISVAGHNTITSLFRTTLQVSTLLYPGSKILKNVFILSKGEHPPQWVMEKIYNFQENGDLSEFLSNKEAIKKKNKE